MKTLKTLKETLCKYPLAPTFALLLMACGGAVGKNDLQAAVDTIKNDSPAAKSCQAAETAAKAEDPSCKAAETACKAAEAACRDDMPSGGSEIKDDATCQKQYANYTGFFWYRNGVGERKDNVELKVIYSATMKPIPCGVKIDGLLNGTPTPGNIKPITVTDGTLKVFDLMMPAPSTDTYRFTAMNL